MTVHQIRAFYENQIAESQEAFPKQRRPPAFERERQATRSDKVVVFAVVAFVLGLLAALAFSGLRSAPDTAASDQTLSAMYGP